MALLANIIDRLPHISNVEDNFTLSEANTKPEAAFTIPMKLPQPNSTEKLPDEIHYLATLESDKPGKIVLYGTRESTGATSKVVIPYIKNGDLLSNRDVSTTFSNALEALEFTLLGFIPEIVHYAL